ncbi:MAG: hypothetical protein Q9212_002239 [Teloschistes hypoglaucus]
MVFARIPMDPSFGASLVPTGPGRAPNASSSALTQAKGRQEDNDEQVTPCANGSYCCGDGSLGFNCCNEGRGVFLKDGTTQKANPTATSSSTTTSQSSLPVSTPATAAAGVTTSSTAGITPSMPAPTPSPQNSKNNAGAIAGGVVGGLAGLSLAFAAIYLILRRRKDRHAVRAEDAYPPTYPSISTHQQAVHEAQGSYKEDYKRSELQAGRVEKVAGRSELDTA